ncbi:endonuclease/exonuclease/phosphatase family protein [Paracoccus sp. S-4012]|uniref:endonuclease/exonuclease/phosphatase family protein n=1 Tax=Paracoccus sp. S-4012 TaxID=2665648 RepID=UPI00351B599E
MARPAGHLMPEDTPAEVAAVQRLSTTAHWDVALPVGETVLHLLAFSATTPVFDGPEDRNGRRNHDEVGFWTRYEPGGPFVVMGNANLDPDDGEGRREAIHALLARVQDPEPRSEGGAAAVQDGANAVQTGDPALDTGDWAEADGPGNLRVDYALPSKQLRVIDSGVVWQAEGPLAEAALTASRHRLVWVDLEID